MIMITTGTDGLCDGVNSGMVVGVHRHRNADGHRASLALRRRRLDADIAAVALHDASAEREPETGALAGAQHARSRLGTPQ